MKFEIIPKTNEEYISVFYDCSRFIDSYRFLSSSLDSLVSTVVDNNHKTLKNLKNELVDNDEVLNTSNEIGEENRTIEDSRKDYLEEIKKKALLNYIGENDLKLLKTILPDKWKYLTKILAYPFE